MVSSLSHNLVTAALFALASLPVLAAEEPGPEQEKGPPPPELHYQTGEITLPNKVASLHLNSEYRYLDPKETEKLLVAWGNPPEAAQDTEGAVVPAAVDPFSERGWAVVLSYMDDGHVDDSDARKIDYKDLMADMKKSTEESNEERVKAGYGSVKLVGWATEPRYDSSTHKMYWAKELDFGSDHHTLNYDVRVLGREGVLSMNAVGTMDQLSSIQSDMTTLLAQADFNKGYRYEEYNKSTDKLAAYGLGALVAGGVAAKLGLFAKLFAVLIAAKKLIIMGVIAIGGFLAKLFKGKKETAAG
jgi:uncharacterized membrane-anchored protein